MKQPKKTKAKIIDELKQKLVITSAQDLASSFFAHKDLERCMNVVSGGIVLEIRSLAGNLMVKPVFIENGLSKESIIAIQADLIRTNLHKQDFCLKSES
jgi:hypothetical protein